MYKILIVDDSKFIRQSIKKTLHNSSKYQVVSEASNGIEALSIYRKLKPDAVTLDLTMDRLDGFKTLSLMVKLYPNAKVIVFSSLSSKFSQTECFKLGAKDFIAKPNFNLLPNALEQIFEGQAV
ncbi:response regulator transcription factor [Piscibacillus salipiscarius]|uniref:Response regulator transcription factor n=1 Tax=Piscibacillus salipiscarius TaxID=299480 RepID=A0ABW5QCM3_9BACI